MQAIDVAAYAYKQVSSVLTTLKKMNLERSMVMQLSWANLFMESTLSYRSQDLLAARPIEASLMQRALKNIFESLFTMSLCHMLLQSWNNDLSTIPHAHNITLGLLYLLPQSVSAKIVKVRSQMNSHKWLNTIVMIYHTH